MGKVLVSGAGIAGNALAFWLSRLGHSVTVVERFPALRASGLQLDLRGPGIQVLKRMGLDDAFRERAVKEEGLRLVDRSGKQWAYFPANHTGEGPQSFTSEYEIMRGDLCEILYDATKDHAKYVFGETIQRIIQMDEHVEVNFSNNYTEKFDLVVAADGQGSHTRKLIFENEDAVRPLGVYAGYFTMPRSIRKGEGYNATGFITTGHRGIMTRRHDPNRLQAYLFCNSNSWDGLKDSPKGNAEAEKQELTEIFRDVGWEAEDILRGLQETDDFYGDRMGVVQLDKWSNGRLGLVGDAAYGSSGMTGLGTTSSIVGAYVLAGEISKHCETSNRISKDSITTAFGAYEETFKPYIHQIQKDLTANNNYFDNFPSSSLGITATYYLIRVASLLRLDFFAQYFIREKNNWELPYYQTLEFK
jgi:2-polyprenyl-6-methoxyphenol hydroxylase-like FAD-dependent oxidoreductase